MSKETKRPDTPLAPTPSPVTLKEKLTSIQLEHVKRRNAILSKPKASSSKKSQSGGSLQGLNASYGVKIVK